MCMCFCSFIYVETAFLWRWYLQQDEQTIATLENLVNEGRLEFIGGGWSMNDEACVHYNAVIDQMSLGMRWAVRFRALGAAVPDPVLW